MPDLFEIRSMTPEEADLAIEWAASEGWNPGLADRDPFLAPDPDGFLMAFRDGEPVASISVVRYGSGYGFLGFYIVPEEHRGKGYAYRLWQAGMDRLSGRVVGLDGVPDQQANYRKSGFELVHRNVRYGGSVAVEPTQDDRLVTVTDDKRAAILRYDADFFPEDRKAFIRSWLTPDHRESLAFMEDGEVRGYGTVRECRDGYKIGPLFCETEDGADTLFQALASKAGNAALFLDPPETNGSAVALAKRYGLEPCFETARMYKGPAPDLPIARTFGITTFELG